jgi:hypothetical protein
VIPSASVTDELPAPGEPDEVDTRMLPAAERNPELADEPIDRLVTRRYAAAPAERDVPSARASAEIAVTRPQPSRHAPWATGTDSISQRAVQPEPGAPVKRRRVPTTDPVDDCTGSVAPRSRESATVHAAASGGRPAPKPGVVAGEIVTDDGLRLLRRPAWRVSTR